MTRFRLRALAQRHPVAILVAAALVLRLATLTWGIGLDPSSGWYHADERKAWSSVVAFPGNYLSNRNFLYGTALQYAVGILLLPIKSFWHQWHRLVPSLSYVQFAVLSVRAVHAVLGALTVALIYRLALRLWDRPTALIAAALLAVSFYHTLNSAFATLDVPMGFLVTLGVILAARAADSPGPREFAVFGLALGFLAGTKITGAALAVAPLTMALGAQRAERRRWIAGTVIAVGVAVIVFVLSTPHVVLHPHAYLEFMAQQRLFYVDRHEHTPLAVARAWLRAMWTALTPPVALLALVGLVVGRAAPAARRVESGVLAFLAAQVLVWRGYLPPRFLLPLVPVVCAYAARALVLLARAHSPALRRVGPALTALVLALSLAAVAGGIWTRWHDPRTSAARAIVRLVPAGSTVGYATTARAESWTAHAWRYPVVDTMRYRLVAAMDGPAFLVVTGWTLETMRQALASGHLEPGYVWPDSLASFWYRYQVPAPEDFRFYSRLLEGRLGYVLVGCWSPATPLPPELSDRSVGLYRRDTVPGGGSGSLPGGGTLGFTCP
jgi:4-amino-4-deoxy-L-arabinose transferase-like glycosyltransferase